MTSTRHLGSVSLACILLFSCDGGGTTPAEDGGSEVDAATTPSGCAIPPTPMCNTTDTDQVLPLDVRGNTSAETDDFGGATCGVGRGGGMGGTGAKDIAFRFIASEAGVYEISTIGSDFDTVLSVRDGCEGMELACNDDVRRGLTQSTVELTLERCQTIIIVVDGYNAAAAGNVALSVVTHESICDDRLDNDGDGQVDCEDIDCFSAACDGGDAWPADWKAFEWEVLSETNRFRAMGYNCDTEGRFGPAGPLEMDALIREASRGHSRDMGERDYFAHDTPDGKTFADRMRDAGFSGASPWGENIAAGQPTPVQVVQGWMESDGHCANIMNPAYHVIGVGYAFVAGSGYGHYWTQDFAASH